MAELDDLLPLFAEETEETIRARFDRYANEGIAPSSVVFTDVRQGSLFQIATEGAVREFARVYDRIGTEVPAAASPLYAWGFYLDDHGAVQDVERLTATSADGSVQFAGAAGTIVAAGVRVAVEPALPGDDAPSFEVIAGGIIAATETVDLPARAVTPGTAGNVAAGAVTQILSALPGATGVTNLLPFVGGTETETDELFRLRILDQYKGQGAGNVQDYERYAREFSGVGIATIIPLFRGPGTVLVIPLTALGTVVSDATVRGLQDNLDPPRFDTNLTAAVAIAATTVPVISTSGAVVAPGFIRIDDELIGYTGLTATAFTGTSGIAAAHASGARVTQSGRGAGRAPIGAHVLVRTATPLAIAISAIVEPETGYALDGDGGTIALRASITAAIRRYIGRVLPGGEIVINQVIAAIVSVPGVHDAGTVRVNGGAVNLTISSSPARVPALTTPVTLTEGEIV